MPEPPPSEAPGEPPGQRLQPAAVPIWFLYDSGRVVLGLVPLLLIGGGGRSAVLGILVPLLLAGPALRYRRFRYRLDNGTLVVEGGLLNRWRRVIPRERVQSVDVVEKLRHRAFGVVELRVEVVGGSQTEAALVALLPDEAERIRRWAAGGGGGTPPAEAAPAAPLIRLSGRDLLLAGMTGGRVAVLAALLGYAQELLGEDTFDVAASFVQGLLPDASLLFVVSALVVGVVVAALVLSVALTILVYWDFTVRLEPDRLVITRGLLERRRAHLPRHRIQAVQIEENLLRRPLGLASLTVVLAGYSSEAQESGESSMLLPVASRERAWDLACRVLGAPDDLMLTELPRTPARSILRRVALPTLLAAVAAVGAAALAGRAGGLVLLGAPLVWIAAWVLWRARGHGMASGFVLFRRGALVLRTAVVPEPNIQHLRLTWSPLQWGLGLATVHVHIPGAERRALDLELPDARRWYRRLGDQRP